MSNLSRLLVDAICPEIEDAFVNGIHRSMYSDEERSRLISAERRRAQEQMAAEERVAAAQKALLDRQRAEQNYALRDEADLARRNAQEEEALAIAAVQRDRRIREVERNLRLNAQRSGNDLGTTEGLNRARREQILREQATAIQQAVDRPSAAGGREDGRQVEAMRMGAQLAELISHSPVDGKVTPEMRSLAAGICSALGSGVAGDSRPGRALTKDLVPGGLYIAKGWVGGEFEWTYIGPVAGDSARMNIRREGKEPSVELLGDHGLEPYDAASQGTCWHPTNWTEGTGIGENTGRRIAELAGQSLGNLALPQEEEDEF
jgi:hypothetical protein